MNMVYRAGHWVRDDDSTVKEENNEGKYVAKSDKGKPEITLVPTQIIRDIARVRMYGKEKYHAPNNWVLVEKQRYKDAMMRHLLAYLDDENSIDEESGIPHYMHAACNMAFLCEIARPDWEEIKQHLIDSDPLVQDQLDKMNKVDCSCIIQECDKPNRNSTIYNKEVLMDAINRYNKGLMNVIEKFNDNGLIDDINKAKDNPFKIPGIYDTIFHCNFINITNKMLHNRLIGQYPNWGVGSKLIVHCLDCIATFELKEYFDGPNNKNESSIWHLCSKEPIEIK